MARTALTVTGNLGRDPELSYTPQGAAVCRLTVASTDRKRDEQGNWTDGETSWFRVTCWRGLAERVAESLRRGDAVVVVGSIAQRSYTDKDGNQRDSWDVTADEVAASMRRVAVTPKRVTREQAAPSNVTPLPTPSEQEAAAF